MTDTQAYDLTDLCAGPATFTDVPFRANALDAGAAVLGCPFDCGTHPPASARAEVPGQFANNQLWWGAISPNWPTTTQLKNLALSIAGTSG